MGLERGTKETYRSNGYVCYFGCSNGYTGVHISPDAAARQQNPIKLYTLDVRFMLNTPP